ncbi:hypothetical protein Tco_1408273 [Tanacetum coccineum]
MADTRTMAQLLQAPTEGYEDAILIPEIVANNFELKHGLINLVQNKHSFGHAKDTRMLISVTSTRTPPQDVKLFGQNASRNDIKSSESKSKVRQTRAMAVVASFCSSSSSAPVKAVELIWLLAGHGHSSGTHTNPREDLKGITTRSGVAYQGPPIPTSSVVKPIPEVTKDQVHPSCSQSTAPVQPPVGPEPITTPVLEPIVAPVVAPVPNTKPTVSLPYPSRRDNEKSRNQANEQIDKFYEIFKEMSFEISFTDALVLMPKFASTLRTLLGNKEKLTEVARTSNEPCLARTSMNEHCSAVILNKLPRKLGDPGKFLIPCEFPGMDECLALADLGASINLMPFSVWEKLSSHPILLQLCMTLELGGCYSISKPMGMQKTSPLKLVPILPIDEPTEVELKEQLPISSMHFWRGQQVLPVIIAKEFDV